MLAKRIPAVFLVLSLTATVVAVENVSNDAELDNKFSLSIEELMDIEVTVASKKPEPVFEAPGVVAMSSMGPSTNGSRFFITLGPLPELDGSRTIFGQVLQGLELLNSLQARDPAEDLLLPPEAIIQFVEIEEQ